MLKTSAFQELSAMGPFPKDLPVSARSLLAEWSKALVVRSTVKVSGMCYTHIQITSELRGAQEIFGRGFESHGQ